MSLAVCVCVCVHEFRDVNKTFHVFNGCCCKMEIFTAAVGVYTYFNCQAWWGIILGKCTYSSPFIYRGAHRRVPHFFFERGSWCDPSNNVCLLFAAFSRKKETPFFFSSDKTFYLGGQFLATIYRQHNPSYSKQNSILPMSGLTIIIMIVIILREIEKKVGSLFSMVRWYFS